MAGSEVARSGDFPDRFPGFTEAQFGSLGEDRIANACVVAAPGTATVGYPLLDGGYDLYLRRILTLRIHPIQVKGRRFLEPDGQFQVTVERLLLDPHAYVVLPYLPPPDFELGDELWAIPVPDFTKLARPHDKGYLFSGYLDRRFPSAADQFLVSVKHIETQWLHRIPGWTAPVHLPEATALGAIPRSADRAFGRYGELWLATELMRTALDKVVIAQDRLRVDCVCFLLHHLESFAVRGLVVHAATISHRGVVEFRMRRDTFFVDPKLDVVLIACDSTGAVKQMFLVPSADIARVHGSSDRGDGGYQISFRFDPVPEPWHSYGVAPGEIASAILKMLVL